MAAPGECGFSMQRHAVVASGLDLVAFEVLREPVASLVRDEEKLLTFYDFPAAHWQTIRSTNVIESAFATVRLRQRVTKGAGTRTRGLTMAFQLLAMAEKRWRKIRSPHLVQELLDGTKFLDGRSAEEQNQEEDAA